MKKLNLCLTAILLVMLLAVNSQKTAVQIKEEQLADANEMLTETLSEIQSHISYLDYIYTLSEQYGIPPEITLAIMKVESGFDPLAVNGNCYGIMQVSDVHCNGFGIETEQLLNLQRNTQIGIDLFSGLMDDSESLAEALGRYNMGTAGYERTKVEVTSYAKKVMKLVEGLEELAHDQN